MVVDLEKHKFTMVKLFGVNVLYTDQHVDPLELHDKSKMFIRYELGYSDNKNIPVEVGPKYSEENFYGTIITDTKLEFEIGDDYINKVGLKLMPGDFEKTDKKYVLPIWKRIRSSEWAK